MVQADGLIVTNAHVVANKATVNIRFHNEQQMEGTVIAVDPVSDLAAIKVHAVRPPPSSLPFFAVCCLGFCRCLFQKRWEDVNFIIT